MTGPELVRAFVDAFNAEDLDALAALCSRRVEIQTRRGIVIGREELRRWATRSPHGHLRQRLAIAELREDGGRRHVLARLRREWLWCQSGEVAEAEELAVVATIRDGLIARWQPFEDLGEAAAAAGLEAGPPGR